MSIKWSKIPEYDSVFGHAYLSIGLCAGRHPSSLKYWYMDGSGMAFLPIAATLVSRVYSGLVALVARMACFSSPHGWDQWE